MDERRDVALAIKSCLDSLKSEAVRCGLADLAHILSLAELAAEDAVDTLGQGPVRMKPVMVSGAGHC